MKELSNMPPLNKRWFQEQFIQRGITQRKVARVLKIDPAAISHMLQGQRKLRLEEAAKLAQLLAQLLALPLDEVLSQAGINTQSIESNDSLDIEGWIDENLLVHMEPPKGPKKAPIVGAAAGGSQGLKVLRFHTAASVLDPLDGGLVYYRPCKDVATDAIGKISVVTLAKGKAGAGETVLLVILKRGYQSGRFNLYTLAGVLVKEDVELKNASPVVWQRM